MSMAQSELKQLKELHERMQAAVDDMEKIRGEASAVSDELSARRRDVLIQLESLRERGSNTARTLRGAPARPSRSSMIEPS
jgi:hypothetical protein